MTVGAVLVDAESLGAVLVGAVLVGAVLVGAVSVGAQWAAQATGGSGSDSGSGDSGVRAEVDLCAYEGGFHIQLGLTISRQWCDILGPQDSRALRAKS